MKRAVLYPVVLLSFSTFLVQCVATQQDVEYTNVKVRKMDTKVEDINKEIEELKQQTMQSVQTRQAEAGDRLDYQQAEILRLQGEIEENNFFIRQVQKENSDLKNLLLKRIENSEQKRTEEINRLNERLALTDEQLVKALERVTFAENEIKAIKEARSQEAAQRAMEAAQKAREAERKARLAAAEQQRRSEPREIKPDAYKIDVSSQNITETSAEEKEEEKIEQVKKIEPEVKTVAAPPPAPAPSPAPPPVASSSFDKGMNLFKQKKYRDAYNSFTEYLEKNPSGVQAVDARYYAAESLYEDKDYELAILEFQKVIVEHSNHALAPKALYKQGLSFEKIGDPETARIVYNKLVDSYPKSEEVASAKTRLESLKK